MKLVVQVRRWDEQWRVVELRCEGVRIEIHQGWGVRRARGRLYPRRPYVSVPSYGRLSERGVYTLAHMLEDAEWFMEAMARGLSWEHLRPHHARKLLLECYKLLRFSFADVNKALLDADSVALGMLNE